LSQNADRMALWYYDYSHGTHSYVIVAVSAALFRCVQLPDVLGSGED
jgi:hypothetical protein